MSTKVTIPTSYGTPTATFWVNKNKYVLPTGIEVDAPDEVAILITQYENQLKKQKPHVMPDVVDVVFTFTSLDGAHSFHGKSNKSLEDIVKELGGRGTEHINLRIKSPDLISMPYKVEIYANQITARWIGSSSNTEDGKYGLLIYVATLTNASGLDITGAPRASITGSVI